MQASGRKIRRVRWFKRKGIATVELADGFIERAKVHWHKATASAEKTSRLSAT
jgi:hypothetical protein